MMTTKKVLYFQAGATATGAETTAINKIIAAGPSYVLGIRNGSVSPNYGAGPEAADYVAGTPPTDYANTTTYPRLDVDNIPTQNLLATQAVVKSGQTKTGVTGSGTTATMTVAANVLTAIALS